MSENYAQIWESLPFPAFILDGEQKVCAGNSYAEQVIGLSEKQMRKRTMEDIFGANSILVETLRQAIEKKSSFTQYGVELVTADRHPLFCDLHIRYLNEDQSRMMVIAHPTGVAQKMNQSLTHTTAARSVTAMASMLAHEIRNPLAGISGAAQLLAMNANDEDQKLAEMIEQETKRIGVLVNRFEAFGDDRPVARSPVNVHDVLDRAVRSALAGFGAAHNFLKEYDPSIPDAAGDEDQLLQVFQNLLKNACEAMETEGGSVRLITRYNSGVKFAANGTKTVSLPLQIEVQDNGRGIPPSILSDIFDPFVSSKSNGTGLGLSLVSKSIAAHGGLIECSSDSRGTRFTLRLPIWHQPSKG